MRYSREGGEPTPPPPVRKGMTGTSPTNTRRRKKRVKPQTEGVFGRELLTQEERTSGERWTETQFILKLENRDSRHSGGGGCEGQGTQRGGLEDSTEDR